LGISRDEIACEDLLVAKPSGSGVLRAGLGETGSVDVSGLVLRDGDTVRASGRVVAVDGATWFDPPLPVPAILYAPGRQPPPRPTGLGVPAVGVDLARLDRRREKQGAVEGWATLAGIWQQERLLVSEQGPPTASVFEGPAWRRPPCPEPAGGWPEGDVDENLEVPAELDAAHGITSVALFRPSRRQVVLVVAAEQPQQVEAELRPRYGARLCVVPSRWTRRQIDDVARRLRAEMGRFMIYICGESTAEDGQAAVTVELTRVLPALAALARTIPAGLLSIRPWLPPQARPKR
jgi:hypothetical protein